MILRRLSQSLKQQNWTAIVIEFILLVSGVFLGIQVSNWNEARVERALEANYISSLAIDVRRDIVEIDEISRISTQRMSVLTYLLEKATGEVLPKLFNSARGLIQIEKSPAYDENDKNTAGLSIFILTTLDGNRLTYDTIINTGGISIIRDQSLVRAIQSYYANVDKVHNYEKALMESRWRLVDAQQQFGLSPVDVMPANELADAFKQDRSLLAAGKNYWIYTNRHMREIKELRIHADALATRLENEKLQ